MKKGFTVLALALALLLALSACGGASLSVVGDGSTVTVEAKSAEDMDGETSITVGEEEALIVAPNLTEGALHVKIVHAGAAQDAMPTIEWDYEGTEPTEYGMIEAGDYDVYISAEKPASGTLKIYTAPLELPDFGGEGETAVYESPDGWTVRYDPAVIEVNEGDGIVGFVYTGESAGTNMLTVQHIEGQMPEEALYELTSGWGDQDAIGRIEGFFPGKEDRWGFWRILEPAEEGSGLSQTAIAGEYNGGTLLFEFTNHYSGDDEMDMPMSDALSEIIDSITYENFEPQTMFAYIPGTYVELDNDEGDYSITLNEDHTGVMHLQDDAEIVWGSASLRDWMNDAEYEYTVEGERLYVNFDGTWVEFGK